jgi:hypothetical protein
VPYRSLINKKSEAVPMAGGLLIPSLVLADNVSLSN